MAKFYTLQPAYPFSFFVPWLVLLVCRRVACCSESAGQSEHVWLGLAASIPEQIRSVHIRGSEWYGICHGDYKVKKPSNVYNKTKGCVACLRSVYVFIYASS